MKGVLATAVMLGMCVADETAAPTRDTPETDSRLAQLANAQPKKIGVLTYYPNRGGGYTFKEGEQIVFYALPFSPAKSPQLAVLVQQRDGKNIIDLAFLRTIATIGKSKLPFGGLTVFQGEMIKTPNDESLREDTPIAKWTRDTPNGQFRLSLMTKDRETRLKLKSIVPLLQTR
jgi:hypothetical protein